MKKRTLLLNSLLLAGIAGSASAVIVDGDIIGIDFGNDDGTTTNWNNLGPINSNITIGNVARTSGGTISGVSFTSSGADGENSGAEFSSSFSSIPVSAQGDWWFENTGGSGFTFTFSGLEDTLTYDLVIGAYNAEATVSPALENSRTEWTAGGTTQTTVAASLSESYVTFSGLTSSGGVLTITSADDSGNAVGAVSALTLTAVPEPSSYALIGGLLALTSVMVRRRKA
ncbi:MAG: PEP-CTERM sorting domain-containing protein [Opitutaceae bacterium]